MRDIEDQIKPMVTEQDLFVLYSPPGDANHYLVLHEDSNNEESSTDVIKRVLVHPFDSREKIYTISTTEDKVLVNPYIDFRPGSNFERNCMEKNDYLNLVKDFKLQCAQGIFDKIVLSRVKKMYRDNDNLMPLFLSLKQKYPNAFIYLLNIPGQSCWIGASPELLLSNEESTYKTMALAGTLNAQTNDLNAVVWGEKEIHEQALVENYFDELIEEISFTSEKKGPYTKKAGNALHLCTSFKFNSEINPIDIVNSFHPSPAVCGLPKIEAFKYITNKEPHPRMMYTGFIGIMDGENNGEFYVNLRCMEVSGDNFYLYIGGGITEDSVPEDEWNETELKASTLQSIIEKMYLYVDVIR